MEAFCTAGAGLPADRIAIEIRVQCGHPSEPEQWGARAYLSPTEVKLAKFDKIESCLKNIRASLLAIIPQRLWSEMAVLIDEAMEPLRGQVDGLLARGDM